MAIKVEDVIPFGSGTSHLGVNGGITAGSFDAGSITPFGHIIQLSGVFVDPVQGQSGILRFNREQSAFETSVDGGVTFTAIGSDVTLSGVLGVNGIDVEQVGGNFVVDGAAVSGLATGDLQQAYDNGNCIDVNTAALTDNETESYRGVVIKLDKPGLENFPQTNLNNAIFDSFGIAVSGHSLTPDDHLTHTFTNIGAGNMFLQSSGTASSPPSNLLLGFLPSALSPGNTVGFMSFGGGPGGVTDFFFTATKDARFLAEQGRVLLQNFGLSGQFTYKFGTHEGWAVKTGQTGLGTGPESDGFFPLPHSGQILQMIAENSLQFINGQNGPGLVINGVNGVDVTSASDVITIDAAAVSGLTPTVTLQAAYDSGEDVTLDTANGDSEYVPILLRETVPGLPGTEGIFSDISENAALVASGHTLTPNNPYTYNLAQLGSNGLVLRGSGSVSQHPAQFSIGFQEGLSSPLLGRTDQPGLLSTGELTMRGVSGIAMRTTDGNVLIDTSTSFFFVTTGLGDVILAADGNVNNTAGTDVRLNAGIANLAGGQINLRTFAGSGQLEYRFGPNEAWHVSPSHTSDFFPIAHSGQVVQMIEEIAPTVVSLQDAYEVNPDVALNDGDMRIIASDDKLMLGTFGDKAPVHVSGIVGTPPSSALEVGDLFMMAHGQPDRDPGTTSLAEIAAESLGIPSIGVGTNGSGIAPIVPASGMTRYKNSASQTITSPFPTQAPVNIDLEYHDHDQYYEYDSSNSGIRFMSPGLYKVEGCGVFFCNGTSTVTATLNYNGTAIQGATASQLVLANTFTTVRISSFLNVQANDFIRMDISATAGASVTLFSAGDAAFDLEYKGPSRGQLGG